MGFSLSLSLSVGPVLQGPYYLVYIAESPLESQWHLDCPSESEVIPDIRDNQALLGSYEVNKRAHIPPGHIKQTPW